MKIHFLLASLLILVSPQTRLDLYYAAWYYPQTVQAPATPTQNNNPTPTSSSRTNNTRTTQNPVSIVTNTSPNQPPVQTPNLRMPPTTTPAATANTSSTSTSSTTNPVTPTTNIPNNQGERDNSTSQQIKPPETLDPENVNIEQIFKRLPTLQQVEQLTLEADQVALVKLIQTVATDPVLTCDQKIAYLLEVLGRVKSATQLKILSAEQMEVIIATAQTEIARLEKEIERIQTEQNTIQLDLLKAGISQQVNELTALYDQYNEQQKTIDQYQEEIEKQEGQIAILEQVSDTERKGIVEDELKINQFDNRIKILEEELERVRKDRQDSVDSLNKRNQKIQVNNNLIKRTNDQIIILRKQIDATTRKSDEVKAKFTKLQVMVERKRSDLAEETEQYLANRDMIAQLQDQIVEERKKINTEDLEFLKQMIVILQNQEQVVQEKIDEYYYECYGEEKFTPVSNSNSSTYEADSSAVQEYLKTSYNPQSPMDKTGMVTFMRVDLFSKEWRSRFGAVFPDSNENTNFSCMEGVQAEKGYGYIRSIYFDSILIINSDNRSLRFKLGGCTRLESTTPFPKAGQRLYWSGKATNISGVYNLFYGTCM